MTYITTVIPAYGRDYSTPHAALAAWNAGKDFKIADMFHPYNNKPCSRRDFPTDNVRIRFNKLQDFIIAEPIPESEVTHNRAVHNILSGSFENWMKQVDKHLQATCGLCSMDLADQPYRDWYEDEMDAEEAAQIALEDEGFFDH